MAGQEHGALVAQGGLLAGGRSCPNYWLGWARSGCGTVRPWSDADGYFPERVAATYDDSSDGMFDPAFTDTVAEVLAGLAGGGRALEFGIGTGRIALPLARRGVEVHGIDLSRAMVARLRAKPGGDAIRGRHRRLRHHHGWTARSPWRTWSSTRSRT